MHVAGLRYSLPVLHTFGEAVALDDGHPLEAVGEDAGGQKTGHAAPDHDGVTIRLGRIANPVCKFR